jgi:hypothetical protein
MKTKPVEITDFRSLGQQAFYVLFNLLPSEGSQPDKFHSVVKGFLESVPQEIRYEYDACVERANAFWGPLERHHSKKFEALFEHLDSIPALLEDAKDFPDCSLYTWVLYFEAVHSIIAVCGWVEMLRMSSEKA